MARTVKCPGCGADLTVKDGNRDFMFCEFCGTKVRLDDYQETHRFVDRRMMPVYIGLMIAIPVIAGIILKFFG